MIFSAAAVMTIFVEYPFLNLKKLLLDGTKRTETMTSTVDDKMKCKPEDVLKPESYFNNLNQNEIKKTE